MNKKLKLFLILYVLNINSSIYCLTKGSIPYTINVSEHSQVRSHNCYIMDSLSYQSGGVSLVYPMDKPDVSRIFITVELKNREYSASEIIIPIITSNTVSRVDIRVNIFDGSTVFEAATDDVTVHIVSFCED